MRNLTLDCNGQSFAKGARPHNDKCSMLHEVATPFDSCNHALRIVKRRGVLAMVYILYALHGHAEECLLDDARAQPMLSAS